VKARDDDVLALRGLPPLEPATEWADIVRRRAHAELARPSDLRSLRGRIGLGWPRVIVSVALTLVISGYLRWAIESASSVYR